MNKIKFKNNNFENYFRPVLEEWIKGLEFLTEDVYKYANSDEAIPPWGYSERTNVSTLVGAIWKSNNYAQQELFVYKPENPRGDGYLDLYVLFTNPRREYFIEAKQVAQKVSSRNITGVINKTKKNLDVACQEVEDSAQFFPESKYNGLGLVFVRPQIPLSNRSRVDDIITQFLKQLDQIDYDFLAYSFPPIAKDSKFILENDTHSWPGVILLARSI